MRIAFKFATCALVTFSLLTSVTLAKKLKTKELVSLHLKAIGENLARKTRIAQGMGAMDLQVGGSGRLAGPAVFVSEGAMLRSSFRFGHPTYSEETAIRNGNNIEVRYITPGQRSQLGQVLRNNFPRLMQEGLYGGILGTDWALLDVKGKRSKLSYKGLKEFDDKKAHQLRYRLRKGVDYNITLYFEPETYHHIASRYRLIIPTRMGRPVEPLSSGTGVGSTPGGQVQGPAATAPRIGEPVPRGGGPESRQRITLEERFQDFKEVDGLSLPHTYRLTVNQSLPSSSFVGHWEMKFNTITHDRAIDPKVFAIK